MFKLAIDECFKSYFEWIHAIVLSLGSTKSVYYFWDTLYSYIRKLATISFMVNDTFIKYLNLLTADALKDFSNENIANVGKSEKTGSSNAKSTSKSKERQGPLNYSHQNMEELFSEEGFAKMAEEFSKAFQSMPADDLDIFKGFNESSLQDSKAGGKKKAPL